MAVVARRRRARHDARNGRWCYSARAGCMPRPTGDGCNALLASAIRGQVAAESRMRGLGKAWKVIPRSNRTDCTPNGHEGRHNLPYASRTGAVNERVMSERNKVCMKV